MVDTVISLLAICGTTPPSHLPKPIIERDVNPFSPLVAAVRFSVRGSPSADDADSAEAARRRNLAKALSRSTPLTHLKPAGVPLV
jgi:hypothetical protein